MRRGFWIVLALAVLVALTWMCANGSWASFGWLWLRLLLTTAAASVTGAAMGLKRSKSQTYRDLGVSAREAAKRGALLGIGCGSGTVVASPHEHRALSVAFAVLAGILMGFIERFLQGDERILRDPEKHYARALQFWRAGDTKEARKAVEEYLKHVEDDPGRGEREPMARRFLEDPGASLEPTTELQAAEPPAGRGTEPMAGTR